MDWEITYYELLLNERLRIDLPLTFVKTSFSKMNSLASSKFNKVEQCVTKITTHIISIAAKIASSCLFGNGHHLKCYCIWHWNRDKTSVKINHDKSFYFLDVMKTWLCIMSQNSGNH